MRSTRLGRITQTSLAALKLREIPLVLRTDMLNLLSTLSPSLTNTSQKLKLFENIFTIGGMVGYNRIYLVKKILSTLIYLSISHHLN